MASFTLDTCPNVQELDLAPPIHSLQPHLPRALDYLFPLVGLFRMAEAKLGPVRRFSHLSMRSPRHGDLGGNDVIRHLDFVLCAMFVWSFHFCTKG